MPAASAPVTATIDLRAIGDNLRALRTRVDPGTALLAAVKGNAYGHGAVEVSRHLQRTGHAEMLGVATVPEAVELRAAGISLPILKLSHCLPDELDAAVAAGIELTVVDEATLREAAAAAGSGSVAVHLKLDSGMGRIGAPLEDGVRLARLARSLPGVRLTGVFTHLATSDVADDHGFTARQLDEFRRVVAAIQDEGGRLRWVHAANSGALLGHDLSGFTLARPGIALYGYYPDATTPRTVALRQAIRLQSRLFFRKWVSAGTSIGYGRSWTAPSDTWIGTVPIGYADGFSRRNSNRGSMIINGRRVPIVGRVCMDQTMIDLGPSSDDRVGDEVVCLGGQGNEFIGTDEMAELMGTISYEVTCLISGRVERRYAE
ncbi:alanine racemase [Tessaracoccus sp. SD287]|uniref:alanine racemase n=1 Tax=Tessaracoccus sp. SD287 TaxID=2782008 RepID=UPI001A97AE78|nr:alanine racemase [Tessaracoccus sp. SD287]MBO1030298.1 alanine racemase [Tessaracoccus sp. SD287]